MKRAESAFTRTANHAERESNRIKKSFSQNFSQGFASGLGIQQGQGLGGLLGGQAGSLLQTGVKAIAGSMTDLVERGLAYNSTLEQTNIAFTTLLSSQEKSKSLMADLRKFADWTPFKSSQLFQVAPELLGVGIAANKIVPTITILGNALSAVGRMDMFDNLMLQFTQLSARVNVSAQDMNSFANAGINGYTEAARALVAKVGGDVDTVAAKMRALGDKGELKSKDFVPLFMEGLRTNPRFADAMKKQSETYEGRKSTREDQLDEISQQGTVALFDSIKRSLNARIEEAKGIAGGKLIGKVNEVGGAVGSAYETLSANEFKSAAGRDTLIKFVTDPKNAGANLIGGLVEGIKSFAGQAEAAGAAAAAAIYKGLDGTWHWGSPSKKAIELGEQIAEGLEIGLKKYGTNYKALIEAAKAGGFSIPDPVKSTYGGKHHKTSAHYDLHALDMRSRDKSPEEIETMVNTLRAKGAYAIYEKNAAGGAHIHAQFGAKGIRDAAKYTGNNPISLGSGGVAQAAVNAGLSQLDRIISENSQRSGIPEDIIRGLISVESSGRANVVSKAGAVGLMQVKPSTARIYGDTNLTNPAANIHAGTSYLADLLKSSGGNMRDALQAYNVGPGNFAKGMRNSYPDKVLGAADRYTPLNPMPVAIVSAGLGAGLGINSISSLVSGTTSGSVPQKMADLAATTTKLAEQLPVITHSMSDMLNLMPSPSFSAAGARAAADAVEGVDAGARNIDRIMKANDARGASRPQRDRLFDPALTRSGIAGDFQGGLQGLLSGLGHSSPKGLLKNFGLGLLKDVQGRAAHDLSSSITGGLFGNRKDANSPMSGGLLSGLFGGLFGGKGGTTPGASAGGGGFLSKLFGSLFGGGRATGGWLDPNKFHLVGERGPELLGPGSAGKVTTNNDLAKMIGQQDSAPAAKPQHFIFVDSESEAQRHRSAKADNFILQYKKNRRIISHLGARGY
jgi:SLT domain-containing protein